ncbi:bifunctional diguanylate cyclase/phosphodiesterase [Deefgea piscis]|uniref:Bifunctional diguanylate cyclase/phosphodiesterase n=2 Tax=Deefgea TaxID=400947 RepID=A0A6M8SPW5_9NEIS|nr:bifunctional diguanylate cyclase/phosphodiesterase [Deefgea piscis]QKJ66184.1 bifunctional diguanylate cyclase/phosphodiesterase [Deefgea piscis]
MRHSLTRRCCQWLRPLVSQFGVYFFFAVVIGLGLLLSIIVLYSGKQVNAVIQPLVNESVPILRTISELKTKVTERQVIMNQYFAYGLNQAQFKKKYRENQIRLSLLVQQSDPKRHQHPRHIAIMALNDNAQLLAERLEQVMSSNPVDADEARAILVESAIDTNELLLQLDRSFVDVSQEIETASRRSLYDVSVMIKLVLAYSLAIVVIAILVAYYIHARQRAEKKLAHAARHDRLTDLLNRRVFEADIAALGDTPYAVILIAIDRFQRVQGGLGYEAGDELLVAVTARLQPIIQQFGGVLYRFESSYFAALLDLSGEERPPELLAKELHDALQVGILIAGHELFLTLSMGGAIYPQDGGDAVTLIRNMDAALEQAQQQGGNALRYYDQEMNARAIERLALEADLRYAIERNQLQLYFQPQAHIHSLQIIGVECLIRWHHLGKLVSPIEFIPLAEESGLIIPMGEWILRTACQQAKAWQDAGTPLIVAINISVRQFQHPHFLSLVRQVLQTTAVDPAWIELEITESVVMQDADHTIELLQQLRDLGVMLSIDDFGTGYSSLSYLRRFPINKLKIDQSFVGNLVSGNQDAAIVDAIVRLGHNLGLTVIAEGVETEAHLAVLAQLHCDEIQGYYFSRPLPLAELTRFLSSQIA